MLIIPAIDIRRGSCVRLVHGNPDLETVYNADPIQTAKRWAGQGAQRIHVVDLDGAFSGRPHHLELAGQMKKEIGCEIEFGGGLRSLEFVQQALNLGIDKLILGTAAILKSDWVQKVIEKRSDRLMVSLDSLNNHVAVQGWKEGTSLTLDEALHKMESIGFKETIYTDISRDGTLEGANIESVKNAVSKTKMKVYASGGISTTEDVKTLKQIPGLAGMVIGKALYTGKISLQECLKI